MVIKINKKGQVAYNTPILDALWAQGVNVKFEQGDDLPTPTRFDFRDPGKFSISAINPSTKKLEEKGFALEREAKYPPRL